MHAVGGGVGEVGMCSREGVGGGVLDIMHDRSRVTMDPRIPTMPGWGVWDCRRRGRHCLHQARSAVRCWSESHEGWAASCDE